MKDQFLFYFAYGSNMDVRQMEYRCPDAMKMEPCVAAGYRFAIDSAGFATIITSVGSCVEGLLWKISPRDRDRLDLYEGVRKGCYRKEEIAVSLRNGVLLKALAYLSNRDERPCGESTASPYMDKVLQAAQRVGLGDPYIKTLEAYARN